MPRFWKRRRTDAVELLLRSNRPEPRADYLETMLARLRHDAAPSERRLRPGVLGGRLIAAAAVTVLAIAAATAAAGGVGGAAHGLTGIVNASADGVGLGNSPADPNTTKTNDGNAGDDESDEGPANHQYEVEICHATGSASNPYEELTLSAQGAAAHLAHHPDDFVEPPTGCPGAKEKPHEPGPPHSG